MPVLCTVVLAGGALPLYVLLPDATPAAQSGPVPERPNLSASQPSAPKAAPEAAEPVPAATIEASEAVDEFPTGSIITDAAPDESDALAPSDSGAASVVPTPRPGAPSLATRTPAADEVRETAAVKTTPMPRETAARETARAAAVRQPATPLQGRRTTVRTDAKLRAGPQGAGIGVLRAGTEVVVGRCERWCEVSAGGQRGYVHASLVGGGAAKRTAERSAKQRIEARPQARKPVDERRVAARRDRSSQPRYDRRRFDRLERERRAYERAYRRNGNPDWLYERELPPEGPEWYLEDEGPADGPPVMLYYEPY